MDSANVSRLLDLAGSSGKMELDKDGYVLFIPEKDELKRMERDMARKVARAIESHRPIFKEAAENYKTYRAVKTRYADGEEEILPLPLAAIASDQIIARTYNTLVQPRPIVSFDPYFNDTYRVIVPLDIQQPAQAPPQTQDMGMQPGLPGGMPPQAPQPAGMPGQMMGGGNPAPAPQPPPQESVTVPVPTPIDAEELARNIERGFEFKARERINLPRVLQEIIFDTNITSMGYVKVCADRETHTIYGPATTDDSVDLESFHEIEMKNPERVKILTLPIWNVLKLTQEDDPAKAEWAERTPMDPDEFTARCQNDKYPLIDKDDYDSLAQNVSPIRTDFETAVRTAQKQAPSEETAIDVMEIQFDAIVKVKDEVSGKPRIKKVSLLADWHNGASRFLCIYRNPYDHQQRFIVPCYEKKDAHTDTGTCTVGKLKWHQKVATHAVQAEIKNAFHANNFSYWWVPGGPAEDYFEANKTLRPGEGMPVGVQDQDWGVTRLGADHISMMPLVQWVEGSGQRVSDESTYKQGQAVPGRTAASTVSQILEQGLQQPLMYIRTLNDSFVRVIRLYLKTARQYQPMGETIPVQDQRTKEIIEIPFRYPIAENGIDPLDNMRIALTASDEALAKEHDPQQLQMFLQSFQQYANFVAQVAGPMANPQASPATGQLFKQIIEDASLIFRKMAGVYRTDEEKFDFTNAVEALEKEREAAQQAMQSQPPQPPQPQIKLNVTAQADPQETAAIIGAAGIGGMSANPNAGGATPGAASGPGGNPGMAPPPGNGPPNSAPPQQGVPPS